MLSMLLLGEFWSAFSYRNCLSSFLASGLEVCQTNNLSPTSPLPKSPNHASSVLPAIQYSSAPTSRQMVAVVLSWCHRDLGSLCFGH